MNYTKIRNEIERELEDEKETENLRQFYLDLKEMGVELITIG